MVIDFEKQEKTNGKVLFNGKWRASKCHDAKKYCKHIVKGVYF